MHNENTGSQVTAPVTPCACLWKSQISGYQLAPRFMQPIMLGAGELIRYTQRYFLLVETTLFMQRCLIECYRQYTCKERQHQQAVPQLRWFEHTA